MSYNFTINDVILTDEIIYYIIDNTTQEDGVRNLQRNLNNIYSYININRYIKIDDSLISFPFTITKSYVDKYLISKKESDLNYLSMYL
jgi:ATP-dependent Lon protease